ncbi:MAG: VOC family protein [Bacteroidales bacterium]
MSREINISGIQQIGIGVPNVPEAWKWYRRYFGVDVRIFEEKAFANFMLPYTGGEPRERHAALAVNMQGGGGFEIWQYTGRIPQPPAFDVKLGDLGIFAAKIKVRDIQKAYAAYSPDGVCMKGVFQDPAGQDVFYMKDPLNNIFQMAGSTSWFKDEKKHTGATYGVIVGVSDIDKSVNFYSSILGYDDTVYDRNGVFDDYCELPGGKNKFRRVLLRHKNERKGSFSKLFGPSQIELVQVLDRAPRNIFENRYWGDLGFIHLCFDVTGMDSLREDCRKKGYPFTVDSFANLGNKFDMGEAAGHFSYIEDPDGTLIEFVETLRVPVLKKLGIYLNLQKRDPLKPLPDWMINALGLSRVKD